MRVKIIAISSSMFLAACGAKTPEISYEAECRDGTKLSGASNINVDAGQLCSEHRGLHTATITFHTMTSAGAAER
jgi:hypothetical protein